MSAKNAVVETVVTDTVVSQPVEFVVAATPITDYGDCNMIQLQNGVIQDGELYIAKPSRSVCKHDGNDLGRAVTLILQLLPLISEQPDSAIPQSTKHDIEQLLLQAANRIETVDQTPLGKCKVDRYIAPMDLDTVAAIMATLDGNQ